MTAVAALLCLAGPALAGPVGGTVVDGAAAISQAGAATNIHQSTNKAIINWQGFSVGANESVNFYQPGASSVTLNRVIGNEASVINGALNANGQVFVVNSAGVLFGKGAQVNVGGLVASTHDISNSDFMAGNYTFSGTSNAAVVNQGRIRAHGGGYVALLGKTVSNEGVIAARLGTVVMSAGEKLTLNFDGNSLLDVTIDKGTLNALVENKRAIRADGGRVIMTAKAADQLLSAQVNNTGIVQARTIAALKGGSAAAGRKGRRATPKANSKPEIDPAGVPMAQENIKGNIKIYAYGGTANIAGTLDASAPKGGDGGFIETSGDVVNVVDGTRVTTLAPSGKAGLWLIDPNDFTVAASGGNMTAATVVSNLATTPFEIRTATMGTPGGNGDIFINEAITWSSDNTLTLTAERNVNINEKIKAEGASAGLVLNAGNDININNAVTLEGASATLAMNFGHDYNIRTRASYSGVADQEAPVYDNSGNQIYDPDGNQIMGPMAKQDTSSGIYGSISFTNAANKNGLAINGTTYTLIHSMGDFTSIASSTPDVNGYISGAGYYALATGLDANSVNGGLTTATVNGDGSTTYSYSAALISSLSGTITGLGHTVSNLTINAPYTALIGLIGQTPTGSATIRDIGVVNANITARNLTGALLGRAGIGTTISNVYATGWVTATGKSSAVANPTAGNGANTGGLIGQLQRSNLSDAFAEVTVTGISSTGGLIGSVTGPDAVITNVHAKGSVTNTLDGAAQAGGLIGVATVGGGITISNAYAEGDVSGRGNYYGGLIGKFGSTSGPSSLITNSFARGDVKTATAITWNMADSNFYGGLVGYSEVATLQNVYATGDVSAKSTVGGLIGQLNSQSSIDKAFSVGNVAGLSVVGGFVGEVTGPTVIFDASSINNAFSTGNVEVGLGIGGGFAGSNQGTISNADSSGNVTGVDIGVGAIVANSLGGFVGINNSSGRITNAHSTGNTFGGTAVGLFAGQNVGFIDTFWATGSTSVTNMRVAFPITGPEVTLDPSNGNGSELIGRNTGTAVGGTVGNPVVLAQQAAFTALRQSAARTGSTVATGSDVSSSAAPAIASSVRAMHRSAKLDEIDDGLNQTERKVKNDDERHAKRRKAAIAAASRASAPRSPSYRGTIRSIDVDGQRFELERDGTPRSGDNTNNAPASR